MLTRTMTGYHFWIRISFNANFALVKAIAISIHLSLLCNGCACPFQT